MFLLSLMTAIASPAQTFTTIHNFDNEDGANPGSLIQATDGKLYGSAYFGGNTSDCNTFCGTVFKITPAGTLTLLYTFCTLSGCADGDVPGPLMQAADGKFYGTTQSGGTNLYDGTVFKITPSGTLTTLHNFSGADGSGPEGVMVQAGDGNIYGTTTGGGSSNNCNSGCGTVFRITPGGALTTLHSFDLVDGAYPGFAGLVQGVDGNLYGTTSAGGTGSACTGGCGTVFKITTNGTLTTLYDFNSANGANPEAPMVQAANGNFYGTTLFGGANNGGTIFKLTPSGTLTMVHSFSGADGSGPDALVRATDGNFYGTAESGGANGDGTIFKITATGTLTTLYDFCGQSGCTDGIGPSALLQDTNGKFYGSTDMGGTNMCFGGNCGTLFSLSVGLRPFVETQPTSGKVGAAVKILGTNLTGATSVTFNGTAAAFKVVSRSLITTTVPAGASTGFVKVKTHSGTLKSNLQFRVKQ
jgi:uncharacterized repeat protein (TIGR03803 family)